jgi:hypothetical protein
MGGKMEYFIGLILIFIILGIIAIIVGIDNSTREKNINLVKEYSLLYHSMVNLNNQFVYYSDFKNLYKFSKRFEKKISLIKWQ